MLESAGSIRWQAAGNWEVAPAAEAHSPTVSALRPRPGGNGTVREMAGEFTGPGTLRGWVRASSEKAQDRLELLIDGRVMDSFSGEETESFPAAARTDPCG